MILQALKEYYDRRSGDPDSGIAPPGFEKKELQFLIVIDEAGNFIGIEDTREKVGSKWVAKTFILPRSKGRSGSKSYETTFLLWDHIGYLLGLPADDQKSRKQHETWLQSLKDLPERFRADQGVAAVLKFYSQNRQGGLEKALQAPQIEECLKAPQCNMAFRLSDDVPVPCREEVQAYVKLNTTEGPPTESGGKIENKEKSGYCLVTGEQGVIARTHSRTPINKDTKCLVGFQKNSGYDSYGKEQGYNAPIIASTEFAYVTGLNTLLKSPKQRLLIGDSTTVFWSKKPSAFESDFAIFFKEPEKDDPGARTNKVRALFEAVNSGAGYFDDDSSNSFYILGLSPNSARIAVRFWHDGTIAEYAHRIKQYFEDFKIAKPDNEPEYYSIWRILVNISTQDKSDNIPPNLAGEFMRSIIAGTPYPATLLQAALRRIRSDTKNRVKPIRAALLKAYLNRYARIYPQYKQKEVEFSLDATQPSIGYQLGRLFATLEKIQEEANPGIGATIRERYYGAACATPVTVFAILLRLKNHHLAKMASRGRAVNFERLLGEIMSHLNDFPSHLDLHEQGRFAIGYYHQRQDFFSKKEEAVPVEEAQ